MTMQQMTIAIAIAIAIAIDPSADHQEGILCMYLVQIPIAALIAKAMLQNDMPNTSKTHAKPFKIVVRT